jgi:hypothetical protein
MVAFAFPTFMSAVHLMKGVILFQRGKKFDIEVCCPVDVLWC